MHVLVMGIGMERTSARFGTYAFTTLLSAFRDGPILYC